MVAAVPEQMDASSGSVTISPELDFWVAGAGDLQLESQGFLFCFTQSCPAGRTSCLVSMFPRFKQFIRTLAYLHHPECLSGLAEIMADVWLRDQIMRDHPGFVIEKDTIVLGYDRERLFTSKSRVSRGSILSFGDDITGYGAISIGENTWIGQYNNLRASEHASIVIGRDCLISQFCTLVGANHETAPGFPVSQQPMASNKRGVRLGDGVWLGAGVTVLAGLTIGQGSVVGAGSVVTKDIPNNEIWVGVPAEFHSIRQECST